MKLTAVDKAPDWLKRDPDSGVFYVDIYRAGRKPPRLNRSLRERESKARAVARGEMIIAKWLGEDLKTGGKRRVLLIETIEELLDSMRAKLASGKLRAGTVNNAELYLGRVLRDEFGDFYWDQWNDGMWSRFVAHFQKEYPTKTLYNHWKHMGLLVNHAHRCGLIEKPWASENPDPVKKTGRVLSEAEKTALLHHAKPNLRDQLIMAMTMGMRLREILKLEWARVNFDDRTIHLREQDTKTKKARTMAMSPQVYAMLLNRRTGYYKRDRSKSERYVFPSRGDAKKPVHDNKSAWRTAKAHAKIKGKCRFHHLRHTFLTECAKLVRQGEVSIVLVCAYAGLSIKTFERVYLHLNHEDTAPVAQLVSVNLGAQTTVAEVKH